MQTVCIWCDSEIVWDEEIGPEEHCPHCLGELGDYRTFQIPADDGEDGAPTGAEPALERVENSPAFAGYTRTLLSQQEDWYICAHCDEPMVHIGSETVDKAKFQVRMHANRAVIPMPFSYEWLICPSCDRLERVLSLADKLKWQQSVE